MWDFSCGSPGDIVGRCPEKRFSMGCNTSTLSRDENELFLDDKRIDAAINQGLQMGKVNEKVQIKLLLLGTGESGKSTVLKQLKLLHKGGFTQQERAQYSHIIWCDAVQSMKILIYQARKLGVALECDRSGSPLIVHKKVLLGTDPLSQVDTDTAGGATFLSDYALRYSEETKSERKLNSTGVVDNCFWEDKYVMSEPMEPNASETIPFLLETLKKGTYSRHHVAEAIHQLWNKDLGIREIFDRSNEFQLEGSASYYFDRILSFGDPNYISSDIDILKGRIKTTGITETQFIINSFKFKVLDAGGQRSERKKWIHCFQDITAILFVIALSEYDQMLFEDERVNRMHEAVVLFESLCNSRWFANTPFILFLNKIDLLERKLHTSPLVKYFPDYNGKPDDVDDAIKFFETNFLKLNRTKKPMYVHRTCATDTNTMKFVLSAVTDMIIQQNLQRSGIL